jgi:hypothetical protein
MHHYQDRRRSPAIPPSVTNRDLPQLPGNGLRGVMNPSQVLPLDHLSMRVCKLWSKAFFSDRLGNGRFPIRKKEFRAIVFMHYWLIFILE